MIEDLRTVVWKEWKSLFRHPGSRLRLVLTVGVPVGYFGVVSPLQAGESFFDGAGPWFTAIVLPLLTVIMTAPDAFAGERERKTLRTLLASRLPDAAILWAKIGFAVMLGMGMMLSTLILAHLVVNLLGDSAAGFVAIAGEQFFYMIGVSILLSLIAAAAAVLISLRAQTVQQAQQMLAAGFFLVPTVAGPLVLFLSREDESRPIQELFQNLATPQGRLIVAVAMSTAAVALLVAARLSFKRNKLAA